MAVVRQRINRAELAAVAHTSPQLNEMLRERAVETVRIAKTVFATRQRKDNEWRLSETTPPKYMRSFKVERIRRRVGYHWEARNTDPAAAWVEFGAHAGGRTLVLRYYPLTTALNALSVRH